MKRHGEERLQARAEVNPDAAEDSKNSNADLAAYRLIYQVLREEPDVRLPAEFAERVARRAFTPREPVWEWVLPTVALLGSATVALFLLPTAFAAVATAVRTFTSAPLPLLAALAGVGILMLADRLLGGVHGGELT